MPFRNYASNQSPHIFLHKGHLNCTKICIYNTIYMRQQEVTHKCIYILCIGLKATITTGFPSEAPRNIFLTNSQQLHIYNVLMKLLFWILTIFLPFYLEVDAKKKKKLSSGHNSVIVQKRLKATLYLHISHILTHQ